MHSILKISVKAQALDTLILSCGTDYSVFCDRAIIFPADTLNVRFCLDFDVQRIDFKSFQSEIVTRDANDILASSLS